MKGISEERLKEYANKLSVSNNPDNIALVALLDILIDECQELIDWKRIDENTPKDRRIWLFYPKCGIHTGAFRGDKFVADADRYNSNFTPTHWGELPPLPKE